MVSVSPAPNPQPTLQEVMRSLAGSAAESVERGKTIFFPGDPAERMYLLRRGAVRLSRVYESGEEITVIGREHEWNGCEFQVVRKF